MARLAIGFGDLAEQIADLRERLARMEAQDDQVRRLQEQIDDLARQVQSIGPYMQDHSIKKGVAEFNLLFKAPSGHCCLAGPTASQPFWR